MAEIDKTVKDIMNLYSDVNDALRVRKDEFIEKFGIQRSQHKLLMKMAAMGDGKTVSQKMVAKEMGVTPAAVAVNLKKLSAMNYIEKIISERDNRYNDINFTRKGKDVVRESVKYFVGIEEIALSDFTAEEKEQLKDFLARMKKNLK
ncbi:MAG: MarR family transcriptional regulator [Lachnospiraceae bacterium]|nr:MarR family transcriptional regulator [Lachnospiraceae bacterium]